MNEYIANKISKEDLNFLHIKKTSYINDFKQNKTYIGSNFLEVSQEIDKQDKFFKVILKKDLKKGDLIELNPMFFLSFRARYHSDPVIISYMFPVHNNCLCEECKKHGRKIGLVGGYASFYRKSDKPNAVWYEDVESLVCLILALRDIKKYEEIFLPYNFDFKNSQLNRTLNEANEYNIPKSEKELWDFDWSRIPLTPTD